MAYRITGEFLFPSSWDAKQRLAYRLRGNTPESRFRRDTGDIIGRVIPTIETVQIMREVLEDAYMGPDSAGVAVEIRITLA